MSQITKETFIIDSPNKDANLLSSQLDIEMSMRDEGVKKMMDKTTSSKGRKAESNTEYGHTLLVQGLERFSEGVTEWFNSPVKAGRGGRVQHKLIGGDPQVVPHVASAGLDRGLFCRERHAVLASDELVTRGGSHLVGRVVGHNLPIAGGQGIDSTFGLLFSCQHRGLTAERIAIGVLFRRRLNCVDLDDRVGQAIDGHIESGTEEVLVVRAIQMVAKLGAVGGLLACVQAPRAQDASELDLVLDATVLVEVPIHAVLIVADRADE